MMNRIMDELFAIEKKIGKTVGCVNLTFNFEKEMPEEDEVIWEKFHKEEEPHPKEVVLQEEGAEGEEAPAEEAPPEDAPKKPAFKVEDFDWTVTDKKPWNLPYMFIQSKGGKDKVKFDVKLCDYYSSSQYEAVSKSLDEFTSQTIEEQDGEAQAVFRQVIFPE